MWATLTLTACLFIQASVALDAGCRWKEGVKHYSLPWKNEVYKKGESVDSCKKLCEEETSFKCRSFDYYDHFLFGKGCYLSESDTYDTVMTKDNDYTYYEIVCDNDPRSRDNCPWVGPIGGLGQTGSDLIKAILDINVVTVKNASPQECMERCKTETTFHCKSFDYHRGDRFCYLQIDDREQDPLRVFKDYDYYERTCEVQGCKNAKWAAPLSNKILAFNDLKSFAGTVEECKAACENEVAFKCRSFEYNVPDRKCDMQAKTSAEITPTKWNNYDYYELTSCNEAEPTDPPKPETTPKPEPPKTTAKPAPVKTTTIKPDINSCGLDLDEGTGSESVTRYYYKAVKGKCDTFTYKGSGGNTNNFRSKNECEETCRNAIPPKCLHDPDPGTGSTFTKKYYYNVQRNACVKFNYSGVGGNENNFNSKSACSSTCKKY